MAKTGRYNDKNVKMNLRQYVYGLRNEFLTISYLWQQAERILIVED